MSISWEGLEEVVAVADAGSFVGGAAILGLSTSHVSRAVARLEQRVDSLLFHRTTRRVALTDTGRAFVDQSRRIIEDRDALLSSVHGSGEPQGHLSITCSIALGERFVAPIIRRFAETHPRISVSLDLTNRVVDIIGEGYDIGIRTGHVADPRLVSRQIASRSIEVCAAPSYLAIAGEPNGIEDLTRFECLIGTSTTWNFIDRGIGRVFAPQGRWRCNSGAAVADAAVAGMGICQLPAFYVRAHLDAGRLHAIMSKFRVEPEPVWAVYPQRRHLMPKVRDLISLLEAGLDRLLL